MPEIWEKHPEVYHYTSADGLRGIWASKTLLATRYDHLNDSSEMRLLHSMLPRMIEPTIKAYLFELWRSGGKLKREIRELGGIRGATRKFTSELATIHFDAAFRASENGPAITAPYVTSFCGHTADNEYEQKNGLLSQWRAYGLGGFAIVFDTQQLWHYCQKELQSYDYALIMFDDVVYDGDEGYFSTEIGPAIDQIKADIDAYLREKPNRRPEKDHVAEILTSFIRLKHRGFKEEREVRIVACPITAERHEAMNRRGGTDRRELPIKRPFQSKTSMAPKLQIELFDFAGQRSIPIKKIIVGPQRKQKDAIAFASQLVRGTSIRVTGSETPFMISA